MNDKILTLHPQKKSGRNIERKKYDAMKSAILKILTEGPRTHAELFSKLEKYFGGDFDGSVGWYGETLKLDLEARGIIERTGKNPHKYALNRKCHC